MTVDLPDSFERRHRLDQERWDDLEFLAFAIQMRHLGTEVSGW